ncbi:hypothetical protein ACTL6U_21365 [Rhodovibrionaceae bacterium A322]
MTDSHKKAEAASGDAVTGGADAQKTAATDSPPGKGAQAKPQKSAKQAEREARLADALRSNLRRRKSQARERRDET